MAVSVAREERVRRAPAAVSFAREDRIGLAHLAVSFGALGVGAVFGVAQALVRSGALLLPHPPTYYQFLTAHGVAMALVFTTFFILGFMITGTARALGTPLPPLARRLSWIGFWLMLAGTYGAVDRILANKATVLYTFYAPLRASPIFYLALTLFIVGSWIGGASIFVAYGHWRRAHAGQTTPLFAFMAVATMVLWLEATLGVAAEALFQLIPWSLGLEPRINVELSRTLFWYFGHPLVYFWLMPAYMAWYVNIPAIIGGKVFSDTMARVAFILLVMLSVPVGFHHELMDTGITASWKFFQVVLTFMVIVPSLMTAFAVTASLEQAGRARGGRGTLGWIVTLPWGDPRFLAPTLGMLSFVAGGAGGMVNASYQMDAVVHNTLWIVGHFHVTLATSVALTFMGIAYWLVPLMTQTPLWGRRLAVAQCLVWVVGMALMAGAMHVAGLLGDPRRTASTAYDGSAVVTAWQPYMTLVGIGGALLGIGVVLFLVIMVRTAYARRYDTHTFPLAEAQPGGLPPSPILERWSLWVGLTTVLVIVAYAVPIAQLIAHAPPKVIPRWNLHSVTGRSCRSHLGFTLAHLDSIPKNLPLGGTPEVSAPESCWKGSICQETQRRRREESQSQLPYAAGRQCVAGLAAANARQVPHLAVRIGATAAQSGVAWRRAWRVATLA